MKFDAAPPQLNRMRCLHYEICWEREPASNEIVGEAWCEAGEKQHLGDISAALKKVMGALQSWSKTKFRNVGRQLEKARKNIARLIESNVDRKEVRLATDHMNELLYKEEMLWL